MADYLVNICLQLGFMHWTLCIAISKKDKIYDCNFSLIQNPNFFISYIANLSETLFFLNLQDRTLQL